VILIYRMKNKKLELIKKHLFLRLTNERILEMIDNRVERIIAKNKRAGLPLAFSDEKRA
jgi:hypothetical protein